MPQPDWVTAQVDIERPSAARMYDYYLGGSHNFAADRQLADRGARLWPELPGIMRANRAFLTRAVRHLAQQGIRQFIDLGSGIPTVGNVHEIARTIEPDARVVYVDIDPVAVAHSRAILADAPHTVVLHADVRKPDAILDDPALRGLIDLDRPVGLLVVALMHFIPDSDDPHQLVGRYREALSPGSHLVLSHFSNEGDPEQVDGLLRLSRATPTPLALRPRAAVTRFFDGLELVEPGVVYLPEWRPEEPLDPGDRPERYNDFCGVGRKR
ncbi:SAM-dependent methyltransferase [Micromonospora sp. NPDC126480]|uniref:SAM-dependent methyltransferase n=1 Tax=Micromonospora sp. NPDC126480 TaxID=3155312 RepID=UPI0033325D1F